MSIHESCLLMNVVYWWKLSIDENCLLIKVVFWWKLSFDESWKPILKLHSGADSRAVLYHNGTEKLITTENGINVTGVTTTTFLLASIIQIYVKGFIL